jgi:hypothetical protein
LDELRTAATALGALQEWLENDEALIALTPTLREFIDLFDWEQPATEMPLLIDIHNYLTLLFLSPHPGVRVLTPPWGGPGYMHPVPLTCDQGPLVEYWAKEVGQLLLMHEEVLGRIDPSCIGVICAEPFDGEECPGYDREGKSFPLIGPDGLKRLLDAVVWEVPSDVDRQEIGFDQARKNVRLLGATRVDIPSGGSHYKAHFENARPWILDPNVDPIPDQFLRELREITGYPLPVIKYVLRTGAFPPRRLVFAA